MNSSTIQRSDKNYCYYCNRGNRECEDYMCKECHEILFNYKNINKTKCSDNKNDQNIVNTNSYPPKENSPPNRFHSGW